MRQTEPMTDADAPTFRDLLRTPDNIVGLWAGVASTSTAEALARAGADYVCIDTQHGLVDYQAAVSMIPAIHLGRSCPIARVSWNEPGAIGKLLDAGAQGIIVPMVNTRADAEAAVRACHYPPLGARSFGPSGAAPRVDGSYFDQSRDQIAVIPMVETVEALANVDDIVSVPGVDAIYVGPADLSISLGLPPGNNDDFPAFMDALERIVAACQRAGVVSGIHSTGALTPKRLAMGFRMVTVTADLVALKLGAASELAAARSDAPGGSGGAIY